MKYIVSFEVEPFHQGKRHHWMICLAKKPEELVSWGHSPTRELAEAAAENEVQELSSGRTQGGQADRALKSSAVRIAPGRY